MGQVFEAEHRVLGRKVAIKLLTPALARDPAFVDRLRLEAQALASVGHPNVVVVHDHAMTPAGVPFLVMELLEGRTLHAHLRERGTLPLGETVRILDQVCAGLTAIHAAGLTHRDLKPANIFLCEDRGDTLVKLLDFGIVKLTRRPENARVAPLLFPTEAGHALGTPRCMAPEQVLGTGCDARTDVYAAGVLLFLLVAGRDPFHDHRTDLDVLTAHVTLPPPALSKVASQPVSAALDAMVARALAKDPAARFASIADFRAALHACLASESRPRPVFRDVTEKITPGMFAKAAPIAPVTTAPIDTAVFREASQPLPFLPVSAPPPPAGAPLTCASTATRLPPSFGLPAEPTPPAKVAIAPPRPAREALEAAELSAVASIGSSLATWIRDPRLIFALVGVLWGLLALVLWRIL